MTQSHHASRHIAAAKYAMVRKLAGEFDGAYWERRRLLHLALAGAPMGHSDVIGRLAVMVGDNPAWPEFLKNLRCGLVATDGGSHLPAVPFSK